MILMLVVKWNWCMNVCCILLGIYWKWSERVSSVSCRILLNWIFCFFCACVSICKVFLVKSVLRWSVAYMIIWLSIYQTFFQYLLNILDWMIMKPVISLTDNWCLDQLYADGLCCYSFYKQTTSKQNGAIENCVTTAASPSVGSLRL